MPVLKDKDNRRYYYDPALIPIYGSPIIRGVNYIKKYSVKIDCIFCQKETICPVIEDARHDKIVGRCIRCGNFWEIIK